MGVWVGGWLYISVYICISFYTYIHIHFFFKNLIVKSIETFVVCAVSRIKLLLLLLFSFDAGGRTFCPVVYHLTTATLKLEIA